MRRGLLLLLTILCMPGTPHAQGDSAFDSSALWQVPVLKRLRTEAAAALVAELNQELEPEPQFTMSSRHDIEMVFRRELPRQMKSQYPDGDDAFFGAQAKIAARGALGFYDWRNNTVHIMPENFDANARGQRDPVFISEGFVRTVLVHEMTHAYDHQMYDLFRRAEAAPAKQQKVYYALIEGHAQYVTRRVMRRFNEEGEFLRFTENEYSIPADLDPGMKVQAEVRTARAKFGYVTGMEFFNHLERRGQSDFVAEIMKKPPVDASVIIHPLRYYHPLKNRPAPMHMGPALERAAKKIAPGWDTMPLPMDEPTLRADFGSLVDVKELDTVASGFIDADQMRMKKGKSVALCTIVQMDTEERALGLLKLKVKHSRAKDEVMKKAVKVTFSDYAPVFPKKEIPSARVVRVIEAGRQIVREHWAGFARGRMFAECTFQDTNRTDSELAENLGVLNNEIRAQLALELMSE